MVTTVVTGTFYLLLPWRQAIYLFISEIELLGRKTSYSTVTLCGQ